MSINLDTVRTLAQLAARRRAESLSIVSVTTGEGDNGRVEILVTIAGCHRDPCRFIVNVSHADTRRFDCEFRETFHDILLKHVVPQSSHHI